MMQLLHKEYQEIGEVKRPKGAISILEDFDGHIYLKLESLDSQAVVEITDDDITGILRLACTLAVEVKSHEQKGT